MSANTVFFVPYHTGYAHADLIHAFASYTDVHLFIYKWNPARERVQEHFSNVPQVHCHEFSVANMISCARDEKHRKIVILLTASTNYLFGQLQLRLFRTLQERIPSIIDVYPIGHCMYGCQSCAYAYTHCLPITFTNYMRTKDEQLTPEKDFEILVCPSYSFQGSPYSLLSNPGIIKYLLALNHPHAIKLHPMALETGHHPFLSLTDLEKQHVEELSPSKSVLRDKYTNTLKLIEHARVIICDSNSSIPFEVLYFEDKKHIFVYETSAEHDEQDDRLQYFHRFQTVEQLHELVEDYVQHRLECKTENSHAFFLEKYDEPTGNEIVQLATVRQWSREDDEVEENEIDEAEIAAAVNEEFRSTFTPMALYALGDHSMAQVTQLFFSDDNRVFDAMQDNASDL